MSSQGGQVEQGTARGTSGGPASDFYKKRQHRSRRPAHDEHQGNRRLWILLSVVFAVYILFLAGNYLGARRKARSAAATAVTPGAAAAGTETSAVSEEAAAVAVRIKERIAAWSRIPDVMFEVQTYLDRGYSDRAEERLLRALEASPNALRLQMRLAQVCVEKKDYARAADLLLGILEANPEDQAARLLLGSVYESRTNYTAVIALAQWVLETDPGSTVAHQMIANAYLNTDRKAPAIQHLRRVTQMDRDNVLLQNKLGMAYADVGDYARAIQVFKEVLARNHSDSTTHYNLAVCYARQGMAEQSAEVLERARALFGGKFVSSWVGNREFDGVREHQAFSALTLDLDAPTATEAPPPILN